ncbi:lipopolysaccharide biosynthesis protein [Albibacterium sp.]|uniref:lipopolysaccharide biosynthesis protein n=1 Tax=Albibacterium sp. TaxID=2952885 RepID=UPI002C3D0768|nr:oligosaccharide flippase family protein [Albibacterium sp.]HUH18898.1 oligosaccharide flippase family protein [Albibacterium sp.]
MIKKLLASPSVIYLTSRYGTYFIQFINSLFIAVYLGPLYLGIWGFFNLVMQYFTQVNFGVPYSLNVMGSINKQDNQKLTLICNSGLLLTLITSIAAIGCLFIIVLYFPEIGSKYRLLEFILPLIIIVVTQYFNTIFSNIYRVFGKLKEISFSQSLLPLSILIVSLFFRGEKLLYAMIWINVIANVLILGVYLYNNPIKLNLQWNKPLIRALLEKGLYLFIYTSSFYFIIISIRTIISHYYTVEEFGFFTFFYTLANIFILLLNSITFLITPKMLNKFAHSEVEEAERFIQKLRKDYIVLAHLLMQLSLLFFPVFLQFFPTYNSTLFGFRLIVLSIVLYTNGFGYQGLLMAKHKEKNLAIVSVVAFLINLSVAFIIVEFLNLSYEYVIIATMVSYLFFVLANGISGIKLLKGTSTWKLLLKAVIPHYIMLPYLLALILTLLNVNNWLFILPLLLFIILNLENLLGSFKTAKKMINDPQYINI